ncbi:Npun_F0296 family exosortase-dependent surface protein [Candidatus Nitrosacidococcus tergens]|uniref:Ice-binding protein C-terminal domain-containing protein n=1 Tax=Candidatus Nitrosacidococcus tergens TaxID=553981 RepID=A0A7G1Q9B9_9GAMM|nr:PEP-CTERM sorting domain-containing protein [Candidatus Nitrosacidococcus tergens]CAB1275743.1 conserved exported protein of unknown function [Candidatus Nitrosacidococcus tergens]
MTYRTCTALLITSSLFALTANAGPLTVSSSVGGAPNASSIFYENFDSLPTLGAPTNTHINNSTYTLDNGLSVDFNGGMVYRDSQSGVAAAPYLSGDNGDNFGNSPSTGQDQSYYLAAGADGSEDTITFNFSQGQMYLGLLWGSVDDYNTLSFFDSNDDLIGTVTGSDVLTSPNGDQGINGTTYVNINSDTAFYKVEVTSTSPSFEFDNMAFSKNNVDVPEPGILGLFGLGLLLMGFTLFNRRNSISSSMIA